MNVKVLREICPELLVVRALLETFRNMVSDQIYPSTKCMHNFLQGVSQNPCSEGDFIVGTVCT